MRTSHGRSPFQLALDRLGLTYDQVLHVGDSLTCDVAGANLLDISVAWLNRGGRKRPPQTPVTYEASDLISICDILASYVWTEREGHHGQSGPRAPRA